MSLAVLKQLCYMLSIAALSFIFAKRNGFGQVQSTFASRLLLYFVNPCLILNSFITPYSTERMAGLILAVVMGIIMHLAFTILATLTRRGGGLAALDRIGIVFTNCGFIGIPLINGALGSKAVFYLMGYIAVFNIYIWIYGARQVGAPTNPLKVLTNPNVLSVIAGVALFCLPTMPQEVTKPISYIGEANTALSMILLGMLFAEYTSSRHGKNGSGSRMARRVAAEGALRMAGASIIAVLLTAAAWHLPIIKHSEIVRQVLIVSCIAALCPIGMSVSTFACVFCNGEGKPFSSNNRDGYIEEQEGDISPSAYSSLLVLSTSAISVITIPLFVRLTEILMNI